MNQHHHHPHHQFPPPFDNNRFLTSFNPNPNFNNPTPPPVPDLSTSLSLLTDLLDLSTSTLHSLSSLISHHPLPHHSSPCPFNPNHLMPPEALFLHSLHCPSPITQDLPSLLDSLHYPKTLKSHPPQHPHSDLCFSLHDYVDFGSNFFYQDCPGVVTSLEVDQPKRLFSLPAVLSLQCANFASGTDGEPNDSSRLLPSELWVVNREIGHWSDFPNAYSYTVLRTILCIEFAKEDDMLRWVIANSPRFGIVIDPPMRDHIFLLFRFCAKAILREARLSYEPMTTGSSENTIGHVNPESMSFICPTLVEVLSWLATQLSVLYGEGNAKLFTIGMLKRLLQDVASNSLVYPLDENLDDVLDHKQGSNSAGNLGADQLVGQVIENKVDSVVSRGLVSRPIFVYQVAVAIAALHERSLLEDKIKALRNNQYMTSYQRLYEHNYLSKRAQDERQKRPNYRPLIDHDGLPVQCQHDKDMMDRNKTKEQLLAEERDYKRRRMSYRGKKAKRNVKEVMRDIIEEHMEAIREAGGIGCFDNGVKNVSVSTSKPLIQDYGKNMELSRSTSYDYEPSRNHHNVYNQNSSSDYNVSQTMEPAEHARDQKTSSRNWDRDDSHHRDPGRERNQGESRDQRNGRKDGNYSSLRDQRRDWKNEDDSYSRNPSLERKHGHSRHRRSDRENEREKSDFYRKSPSIERHERSTDRRSSWRKGTDEEIYKSRSTSSKRRFEDKDRERRKRVRSGSRSDSISEFDDRYAPSRSPDR